MTESKQPPATCCAPEPAAVQSAPPVAELARLARALGHPVRVQILKYLLSRQTCVCGEIVEQLPLAQSTVSQHLKVLKQAGLIQGEVSGPKVCYCVNRGRLATFKSLVAEF